MTVPGERLERLTPEQLDEGQRALYQTIAGGERARGRQHFPLTDSAGALHGPFGIMLQAPELGMALQALGAAIRFHTDLTARVREIAILQVAQSTGSRFEWWAHTRVGRAVGLTDDEITELSMGGFTGADPIEAAAARLCRTLLSSAAVSDQEYTDATAHLTTRQITELTVLVGYYTTLAQLMTVFAVDAPQDGDHPGVDDTRERHCAH